MYQPKYKPKKGLIAKIPNNEARLITFDIIVKHPMMGVNDQLIDRTGRLIEQWLEKENF